MYFHAVSPYAIELKQLPDGNSSAVKVSQSFGLYNMWKEKAGFIRPIFCYMQKQLHPNFMLLHFFLNEPLKLHEYTNTMEWTSFVFQM